MNYLRYFAAILAICLVSTSSIATTPPAPPKPAITTPIAVTQVAWTADGNGFNRCVSFSDAGPLVFGEAVSIKHWLAPGRFETHESLIAPTRSYRWRIKDGVFYIRWEGTSGENKYLIHPYGTTTDCAYVIQIVLNGVNVTVDGLVGGFNLGSKIPIVPVNGQYSGSLTFTGAADVDPANPGKLLTGVWFRPVKVKSFKN